MADGYRVERHRLGRQAAVLAEQRNKWDTEVVGTLSAMHIDTAAFTIAGVDLTGVLEGLRERYADYIATGISGLMGEVVAALERVRRSYGDAEEASVVAKQGDRLPTRRPSGGDDNGLGDILSRGTR